jgi:hypothetical protein
MQGNNLDLKETEMISYFSMAVNPANNTIEEAFFLEDYFGKHKYGVLFSDGKVYPEDQVKLDDPKDIKAGFEPNERNER